MRKGTATLTVCGAASIGLGWSTWISASDRALGATEQQSGAPCVDPFSKDSCNGVLAPVTYEQTNCAELGCTAVVVKEATYTATLQSSGLQCIQGCLDECDEFPDGELTVSMSFVMSTGGGCCPSRGFWTGSWEYNAVDGRIFQGDARGTVGVGTNRSSACLAAPDDCEQCADFRTDATGIFEYYGFEGAFGGQSINVPGPQPQELHFTMDGAWQVPAFFPEPFRGSMTVFNRFDGVFVSYCPS